MSKRTSADRSFASRWFRRFLRLGVVAAIVGFGTKAYKQVRGQNASTDAGPSYPEPDPTK